MVLTQRGGEDSHESFINRLLDWLGLQRDIIVMVVTVLILTMGNQIWLRYTPKYLEHLGASVFIIGLYGFIERLVGAVYQYPGGTIADKIGSKNALILFSLASIVGYVIYYFSPSWEWFILGTFFVLVWESMSSPAIFSLIGEVLSKSKRATGFSVQSILKRIPIILAPPIGGYLVQVYGLKEGMKIGFLISIFTGMLAIAIQRKFYTEEIKRKPAGGLSLVKLWSMMDRNLKHLLIADILARTASYMVKVYVVLYVLNIVGASPLYYGFMISLQMTTSILSYLPAAKLADIYGRKPFVATTFFFFAIFPLALVSVRDAWLLPLAFIIAGLREVGEPARKALIVDLAGDEYRGRIIGLYYLVREFTTMLAPLIGGFLWMMAPEVPFYAAFIAGVLGVIVFIYTK